MKGCLVSQVLTQVKRRRAWVCPAAPATSHHVPLALNGPVSVAEGTRTKTRLAQAAPRFHLSGEEAHKTVV